MGQDTNWKNLKEPQRPLSFLYLHYLQLIDTFLIKQNTTLCQHIGVNLPNEKLFLRSIVPNADKNHNDLAQAHTILNEIMQWQIHNMKYLFFQ